MAASSNHCDPNYLWYKDAIIYELHVRSFFDADGDGIGDFRGLIAKLDYLHDLGVTAIWLLPFYPSPLKDDGYDVTDYTNVNPLYGKLADFKQFIREAHRRNLKVITELVCNHTSDQHPWFQRARRARPGSVWRNYYVWSDTDKKYSDARIIFKDFEESNWTWDPVAGAYYWHRFYSHQPDLNFDNPRVRQEIIKAIDFWLKLGVDGLRLDAVPYLYEREHTICENLPETHAFLKEIRRHVDRNFRNRMLLAEANQWPEQAQAYFGEGDECHMAFHFPLMPRLFMSIRMENRLPVTDIMAQTPVIPETAQWALFLRNHDELTLEMVTEEERYYMYQVYANDPQARINLGIRRRLAPLLGNHRRRIELLNGLLFSLPGTPVIYYGDEIGMGDNIYLGDRNSVRTPMQWNASLNAGFSRANRQRLYLPVIVDPEYHYETVNVEAQANNPHSLLNWMKRLIALRKRYRAFGQGSIEFLEPKNSKVLAFLRHYQEELILVVANLSRFVQCVELDLSALKGMVPYELFGRVEFPPIGELPYFITLAPHSFYYFSLERPPVVEVAGKSEPDIPLLQSDRSFQQLFRDEVEAGRLASLMRPYLHSQRWFGGKARHIISMRFLEAVPIAFENQTACLTLLQVNYSEGNSEIYAVPLAFASGERAQALSAERPPALVARLQSAKESGVIYDALSEPGFSQALLEAIVQQRRFRGSHGTIYAAKAKGFQCPQLPPASPVGTEQSNSSVAFADRLFMKLFRRVEEGINPELAISRFLTEKTRFGRFAPYAGSLEYRSQTFKTITLGILLEFVPSQGDAWRYTLESLNSFFQRVKEQPPEFVPPPPFSESWEAPAGVEELMGSYLKSARLLGQRTAELHQALSSEPSDPGFAPEPFSLFHLRSIYQSMRSLSREVLLLLSHSRHRLPPGVRAKAERVLGMEAEILMQFNPLLNLTPTARRIHCHGDYHLGQVLCVQDDFLIIDFEGEPARSMSSRQLKRSALRDVATMLRSFHYAVCFALRQLTADPTAGDPGEKYRLEQWGRFWQSWASSAFLHSYCRAAQGSVFLPRSPEETEVLLRCFELEKAIYELGYEINNRPDWIEAPLQGILELLGAAE